MRGVRGDEAVVLRRRMRPAACVSLTLCASLAAIGCAGDDTDPALPPAADASIADVVARDAPSPGEASVDAEVPPLAIGLVRVANWSPDSPEVDFCLAPQGTSAFQGPLLAQASAALDAGAAALPYPSVSAYFEVAPGHYDARVVVAGAANCDVGVAPDLTSLAPLGIGMFATLALLGSARSATSGAPRLVLAAFLDDGVGGTKVALRFINAGFMGTVDFGTGKGATFKALFQGVAFGAANAVVDAGGADGATSFDARGYALLSALSAATLSARATGGATDAVVASGVTIATGAAVTTALLGGEGDGEDGGGGMQLLECVDNAGTVGLTGSCAILSP